MKLIDHTALHSKSGDLLFYPGAVLSYSPGRSKEVSVAQLKLVVSNLV